MLREKSTEVQALKRSTGPDADRRGHLLALQTAVRYSGTIGKRNRVALVRVRFRVVPIISGNHTGWTDATRLGQMASEKAANIQKGSRFRLASTRIASL
jgi:hypothetical protein